MTTLDPQQVALEGDAHRHVVDVFTDAIVNAADEVVRDIGLRWSATIADELDRIAGQCEVEAERLIGGVTEADAEGLGAAGGFAALTRQAREIRARAAELRENAS